MALSTSATLVVGTGNFYTATYSATTPVALPTNLGTPGNGWTNIGYTSLSDIFSITSDGGDATTVGTLQNKSLRTSYSTRTESFNITLQQFDSASLKLYYGSNASVNTGPPATVSVPANPTPTVATFLAVFTDGANQFAIYVPKCEIFRADDIAISDTENLASLPLSIKPLQHGTNDFLYQVTSLT